MVTFLFSPYGRVSRKSYWLQWLLPYFAISIAVFMLDYALFPVNPTTGDPQPVFQLLATLILFWPSIALTTKRLHDRGMTGWWQVAPALIAVPILAIASYWYYTTKMNAGGAANAAAQSGDIGIAGAAIAIVIGGACVALILYPLVNVLFLRGQAGLNQYGEDPLAENTAEVFS